jgi:hypothetical protein
LLFDRWRWLFIFNFEQVVFANEKMDTPTRKRKREIQETENDEYSFVFGTCGLSLKRRKKTAKSALPFPKIPKLPARFHHHDGQVLYKHFLLYRQITCLHTPVRYNIDVPDG